MLFTEQKSLKTVNQTIIILISEKGNQNKLRYQRPISLLCVEYKVITKLQPNRFKKVLPNVISKE